MYTNRLHSSPAAVTPPQAGQGSAAHHQRRERNRVPTTDERPAPAPARTPHDELALAQVKAALRNEPSELSISQLRADGTTINPAHVRFTAVRTGSDVTSTFSSGYSHFVVNLDDVTTTYFATGTAPHCIKGAIVEAPPTVPHSVVTQRAYDASAWLDEHANDRPHGDGWDKPLFDVRA